MGVSRQVPVCPECKTDMNDVPMTLVRVADRDRFEYHWVSANRLPKVTAQKGVDVTVVMTAESPRDAYAMMWAGLSGISSMVWDDLGQCGQLVSWGSRLESVGPSALAELAQKGVAALCREHRSIRSDLERLPAQTLFEADTAFIAEIERLIEASGTAFEEQIRVGPVGSPTYGYRITVRRSFVRQIDGEDFHDGYVPMDAEFWECAGHAEAIRAAATLALERGIALSLHPRLRNAKLPKNFDGLTVHRSRL